MKVLFVDHSFHIKTKSSHFFADLLRREHAVDFLYIDPEDYTSIGSLDQVTDYDLVVLWQLDFLAPLVLARGVATVVVPMYDGSSLMPDLHWLWARKARFVNFSRRLHDRIQFFGCDSLCVRYFLPPVPVSERARFDKGLKVLLWQRRPEDGINLQMVERLFAEQLVSVHVHDAADNSKIDTAPYLRPTQRGYTLTQSRWFESRSEFDALLRSHNVLIAPRCAEGIGMAMLEGLAHGMLVCANDSATHDEYLSNFLNGVLFNTLETIGRADFSDAARIGEMAWRTAREGYERWLEAEGDILDFVKGASKPVPADRVDLPQLDRALIAAYYAGGEAYASYLATQWPLIEAVSGIKLAGKLDSSARFNPNGLPAPSDPGWATHELQWLAQNRFSAATLAMPDYILQGRILPADNIGWVAGETLVLGFRLDPQLGATRTLRLRYRLPGGTQEALPCCFVLNNVTLHFGALSGPEGEIECLVPPHAVKCDNRLQFVFGGSRFAEDCAEPISIGLRQVEFIG